MEAAANSMAFYILPPGYKFRPNDEEKMIYVTRKISNLPLRPNNIRDVDISKYHPQDICETQGMWYFFTPRKKLNKNSKRAIRKAGDGFWKATSGDQPILKKGQEIGVKTILAYYENALIKSDGKTDWFMHEYRVRTMDDLVLCEIYYRETNKSKKPAAAAASCNDQINDEAAILSDDYQNNSLIARGPASYTGCGPAASSTVDIQTGVHVAPWIFNNHGINGQIHEVAIPSTFSGFNPTHPTHTFPVSRQVGFMHDVPSVHDLSTRVPTPIAEDRFIQESVPESLDHGTNGAMIASYTGPADILSEQEQIPQLPCGNFDANDIFDIDKLLENLEVSGINLDGIEIPDFGNANYD